MFPDHNSDTLFMVFISVPLTSSVCRLDNNTIESFMSFHVVPLKMAIALFIAELGQSTPCVVDSFTLSRTDPSRMIKSPDTTVHTGAGNVPATYIMNRSGTPPTVGNTPEEASYGVGAADTHMSFTLIATLPNESSTNLLASLSWILI